jgi:hypothetical protein
MEITSTIKFSPTETKQSNGCPIFKKYTSFVSIMLILPVCVLSETKYTGNILHKNKFE